MTSQQLFEQLSKLSTEQINPETKDIDILPIKDILRLINQEDKKVAFAIEEVLPDIELAVEKITESMKNGGKLFYFGAGTSGRLGILDASECPPTFGVEADKVQGVIAGGNEAVFHAVEGAEDFEENGANDVIARKISSLDVVCGLAASGRTPYVKGALNKAKEIGCTTIMISTVSKEMLKDLGIDVDIKICPEVGAEVIMGSTRMKSGTAQKLVLNMLTSAAMIKLGKTYNNVMIDLQLKNKKLVERAKRTLMQICDIDYENATRYLELSDGHVKTAIVMILADTGKKQAEELIEEANGFVKLAIKKAVANSK